MSKKEGQRERMSFWSNVTEQELQALRDFREVEHAIIEDMMSVQTRSWERFWAET